MKRLWVNEHERLWLGGAGCESRRREDGRVELSPEHYGRLQRFDESLATSEGRQVFEWRTRYAKATQWVGVMQVRGLSVEVLPKIEEPGLTTGDARERFARKNLLYMLSLTGELPIRERDFATQAVYEAPLIEALIRIFSERLFEELNRGVEHGYVRREENLHVLKGKLLFTPHVRHNAGRRERVFVAYDEFVADTPMNRIFRAGCQRLLLVTRVPSTQERLEYCLMMLDGVADRQISSQDFDRVLINRQNERFRAVFNFCRLILLGHSPASSTGKTETFSLFFDMNVVFEMFVAELVRRYALKEELSEWRAYAQSKSRLSYLVFKPKAELHDGYNPEHHGGKTYPLKADLLLEGPGEQKVVLDTKWKSLTAQKGRQGVSRDDLLQLYAYGTRYGAQQNILLYPRVDGVEEAEFHLPLNRAHGLQSIEVRFLELRRDLQRERVAIVAELRNLFSGNEECRRTVE